MKVLVAEDSETQRRLLCGLLRQQSLEPVEVASGSEALDHLLRPDGPRVALVDWEMPGLSGVEVCQKVREATLPVRPHLILVTGRNDRADVVAALDAGADDYLTKPPHPAELQARVQVGLRNVQLQEELMRRIGELEAALRRLDLVGAVAARATGGAEVVAARREGALQPELEALDAVRGLPERFASVLATFRGGEGKAGPAELWAHLALALPRPGAWLDVTLEVNRALAAEAFNRLSGHAARTDQSLLDGVSDVLTLVTRGFVQQLEDHGVPSLKPLPARAFVGTVEAPQAPHHLVVEDAGWKLQVFEFPAPVQALPFHELHAATVLVQPLTPPELPDVEVLARGTVLKASYLTRAGTFFRGDAASTPVSVMELSPFARAHRAG